MSAHLITVPHRKESASARIGLFSKEHDQRSFPATEVPANRLSGILGLILVAGILGSGVYVVLHYLF